MKKIFLFVVLAILLSFSAFAMEVSNVALGSKDANRGAEVSATFTIKNTDPSNNLTIKSITDINVDSKYNISFVVPSEPILPNSSVQVTVKGFIPYDLDAVSSGYELVALNIGTFNVKANGGSYQTKTASITMQAKNNLEISRVRLKTDISSRTVSDRDTFRNVRPGDEFVYEVEVRNLFSSGERVEFESVFVKVNSESYDVDIYNDDDEIRRLAAGEREAVSGDIIVEEEADRSTAVFVYVYGRDENGALHGSKMQFSLDVTRLTHDLQIRRIVVNPSSLDNCLYNEILITPFIKNMGRRNERNVFIEVSVEGLKYSEKKEFPYTLEKDDSGSLSFIVPVDSGVEAKTYQVVVKTFFDEAMENNIERAQFSITQCPVVPKDDDEEKETAVVNGVKANGTEPDVTTTVVAQPAPVRKSNIGENALYLVILVALSFLVLVVIMAIIIYTIRSGSKKY